MSEDTEHGETENKDLESAVEGGEARSEGAEKTGTEQADSKETAEELSQNSTGEMVDRLEIKARKAAKKKKEKAARAEAQDEISLALKEGYLGAKKKKRTKNYIRLTAGLLGLPALYFLYILLFTGFKAGPTYGICKAYLERSIRFPLYLKYISLTEFNSSVRIWYKRVDSFGAHRMESIRCYYRYDKASGRSLVDKVEIDRREEPAHKIEAFNKILPVVLKNLPDLTLPQPDSDKNLDNLNIDTETRFRKPIL